MTSSIKSEVKGPVGIFNNIFSDVYEAALFYYGKGLSVIPLKHRSKEPIIKWAEYQGRVATIDEFKKWFEEKERNIAIICGRISGNLIVIDFDNEEKFKWFIEEIVPKLPESLKFAISNTWIVKTGKGYHIYLRVHEDPEEFAKRFRTKPRFIEGVDIKGEGGYVVAPPSIHPSGKQYMFIINNPKETEIQVIDKKEWDQLLKHITPKKVEEREGAYTRVGEFKQLNDNTLIEIKELLKDGWIEGHRQYLALFISGWFGKARIHPICVAKLFKMMVDDGRENELEERLSTIYYSYKKLYGNIPELQELDKLIEEWRNLGIIRRSVSKAISKELEESVKGKSGVQEILENVLGEERALEVIRRIEDLLGVSSPFRDSIFELLDYDKQLYAVANLRKLIMARVKRDSSGGLKYKERVSPVAPTKVIVYYNPLGGLTKYEVTFEGATLPRPLVVGPAPIEDIVGRLRAEGLVYHRRLIEDVLSAIIQGFIRKGKAEVREEIESPGFYLVKGKIIVVRWKVKEVNKEELKEALIVLNELAKWYDYALDRYASIIKWYIIAPFIYIYKVKRKWVKWLYLYGPPDTGKSTLNKIGLSIWGLPLIEKPGSSIDTIARIGHVLSSTTFPIAIKEPGGILSKNDVLEVIKSAIEDIIARGKYVRGVYTEIPALAPLSFTSNRYLPRDEGLLKRLYVITFSWGERRSKDQIKEFKEKMEPQFSKLAAIGHWVAKKIMEDPSLLDKEWEKLAEELLEEAYREVGLDVPEWVKLWYEAEESSEEEKREAIRNYLIKVINEEFTRFVGKVVEYRGEEIQTLERKEVDFEERVRIVLENKLIPWAIMKDGETVIFTTGFAETLKPVIGDIGGLKSIADLLNWEYRKSIKINKRVIQGIVVKFNELMEFLA